MSFNLGEILQGQLQGANVSKLDTSGDREQIEYIDIDRIGDDPNNFYALNGLEELAASIELLGLQQPLRVRQDPQDLERVITVSGHRRKAALEKLVKEGRTDLREVPCIREREGGSAALQELRLIYANSDTRVLTSAELSRQAERVEMLLYQLKEEGMEFPGRMRNHVAEAVKISAPKLARLKVIREKLIPEYLAMFDKDKLPEMTAYAMARLPEDFQQRMIRVLPKVPSGNTVEKVLGKYNEGWRWEPKLQCPDGKPCKRGDTFLRRDCEAPGWSGFCGGNTCCLECAQAKTIWFPCERMCSKAKAQRKEEKEKADAAEHRRKQREGRKYQKETQRYAKRFLRTIDAAGLAEDTKIKWCSYHDARPVAVIRQWAAGEFDDPAGWYFAKLEPGKCDNAVELARLLNCSTDFLMGLTDELRPVAAPEELPREEAVEKAEDDAAAEPQQDISEILDGIAREESPVRRVRWESRGRTPPEEELILTYQLTNAGPQYQAAVWDGARFLSPDGRKELTGLQYTHWLEVLPPASGEMAEITPPAPGWMPSGMLPREPCDVVADFRSDPEPDAATFRTVCRFDGECFRFSGMDVLIDEEVVRWIALPPTEAENE